MKTIIIGLSLLATLSAASFASNPETLREYMEKEIVYPQEAKENKQTGFVLVHFTIEPDGKVQIKETNSDNNVLKSYVERKLQSFQLPEKVSEVKEHIMKFTFKLI